MHPEFEKHGSFHHLKLGRQSTRHDERTLLMSDYIDEAVLLPKVPRQCNWALGVTQWPMYGNDKLGDCTIAAVGHIIQTLTTAAGHPVTPPEEEILKAYIPGTGSADTGRVEIDVLNYWRNTGVAGDKLDAWVKVNAQNIAHVRLAIYLFGSVYVGLSLPENAARQSEWSMHDDGGDFDSGSWGGHAVPYVAYDSHGTLTVVTWGALLKETVGFHKKYCDEVYAPLSRDFLEASGKTPDGLDLSALQEDLAAIAEK